ncbi:ABC transporter substrate-binding protein [Geomonas sp. RF6]|uniref:ABC transporter substrate-binding protein n=1 Tax=Geomonas sp. RF6 TaxID=2897342 RepID=UPI001E37D89A|nr:ABC transporter substrate binding protein [Geomonas sp. RF6]UFS71933.1 ABC transporter substrate-binding protein [Geomonas sp. RF6]
MRRLLLLCIAVLFLILPCVAEAYQVLLLLSTRDPVYTEAASAFRRGRDFSHRTIVLSDYQEADLARVIREDKPSVIVAVGDRALAAAKRARHLPVISLMSLSFSRLYGSSSNVTGVELFVRPERHFPLFEGMNVRRVGVLYNPARSGIYMRKVQQSAARSGIEIVTRVVNSPKDALGALASLKGSVDAIWMIPDASAVDHKSAEAYFLFSLAEKIPVISFDRSHLQLGAAAVIEADREEMGRQAAEMAADLLAGRPVHEYPLLSPAKSILKVNQGVLKHLGIFYEAPSRQANF